MRVYFDNAASTFLRPEVSECIINSMNEQTGNPSSIHHFGRIAKVKIENARKSIAEKLAVSPAELFFTSGATEGNNLIIRSCIENLKIKDVISTAIEHPSVLNLLNSLSERGKIKLHFLKLDENGKIKYSHLEELLEQNPGSLVCLMHANNEIANLLSVKKVSGLCKKHDALFHSDMVQSIGHYNVNLQATGVDFASFSAHKFHGPKGVGGIYINGDIMLKPVIIGGSQERNMRAGTENFTGIIGMEKALKLSLENLNKETEHITSLKNRFAKGLEEKIPGIEFVGNSRNLGIYTILSVSFPANKLGDMLLLNFDIDGICASSGSACSSGTVTRSHVIDSLNIDKNRTVIRFSFSFQNTFEEVDYALEKIEKYFKV